MGNLDMTTYNYSSVIFVKMDLNNVGRSSVISEEEKESNPVLKVVYNKIRNLQKKITQIQHIESLDRKSLKTAQINKLNRKEQILQQICSQQKFAVRYKAIMVEHNLTYEKVDDLIRVSTLLAVGNRIKLQQYCPEQTAKVNSQIYEQIFDRSTFTQEGLMSGEIVRIYRLLEKYLANERYQQQCKDYMTYLSEIDGRNVYKQIKAKEENCFEGIQKEEKVDFVKLKKITFNSQVFNIIIEAQTKKENSQIAEQLMTDHWQKNMQVDRTQGASTSPDSEGIKPEIYDEEDHDFQLLASMRRKQTFDFIQTEEKALLNTEASSPKYNQGGKKKNRQRKNNYFKGENIRKCSEALYQPSLEPCRTKAVKYRQKIE